MAKLRSLKIGQLELGGSELFFILGPCVIESPAFTRRMAKKIRAICDGEGIGFVFKASYDKANRTSVSSFRGPAIHDGCALLAEIGAALEVPVRRMFIHPRRRKSPHAMWIFCRSQRFYAGKLI